MNVWTIIYLSGALRERNRIYESRRRKTVGKIYETLTELTGHTPIFHLKRYEQRYGLKANIYAKLEFYNPNQSSKDRIAAAMIEDAEKSGRLKPGDTVVEMTSGNTGVAVAAVAAAKGYRTRIYMQDDVSEERFKSIHAFGGETIKFRDDPFIRDSLIKTGCDFVVTIEKYTNEVLSKEKNICFLEQEKNPENPAVHERTTGPEIWEDTDGNVDIFVATTGTGGTITGTSRFLKKKKKDLKVVGVQPGEDSLQIAEHPDVEEITGIHPFDGVSPEQIPLTMDPSVVDETVIVETEESKEETRILARTEGLLAGTSSGAALLGARRIAEKKENEGKNIVVIFPDSGARYLSTDLFD